MHTNGTDRETGSSEVIQPSEQSVKVYRTEDRDTREDHDNPKDPNNDKRHEVCGFYDAVGYDKEGRFNGTISIYARLDTPPARNGTLSELQEHRHLGQKAYYGYLSQDHNRSNGHPAIIRNGYHHSEETENSAEAAYTYVLAGKIDAKATYMIVTLYDAVGKVLTFEDLRPLPESREAVTRQYQNPESFAYRIARAVTENRYDKRKIVSCLRDINEELPAPEQPRVDGFFPHVPSF